MDFKRRGHDIVMNEAFMQDVYFDGEIIADEFDAEATKEIMAIIITIKLSLPMIHGMEFLINDYLSGERC